MQFSSSMPMSQKVLTGRDGSYGSGRPIRFSSRALGHLALEVGALERAVEALLHAGWKLRLHVVGALLVELLGVPSTLLVG
jgi:hypothetical protein